jgi:Cu2+-containing amine oxidase
MKLPLLLPGIVGFLVASMAMAQEKPQLPLDPLTPEEARAAERVVTQDARVRELVGGNGRVIYVQFIAVKQKSSTPQTPAEPSGRFAEVLLHIDPSGGGIHALVDLTAGRVIDVVKVAEASVPIGVSDVELAAQIALADPALQRLLGERAKSFHVLTGPVTADNANGDIIEGLHTIGASPNDPCTTHRCVVLLFSSGGRYLFSEQQITVDLTSRKLMLLSARPAPARHKGGMQ